MNKPNEDYYVSEYNGIKDPLQGFERFRKLKRLIELYDITTEQICEIINLKSQTVRVFRTRGTRQNITTTDLQKLYTHFGGVDALGRPLLNVFKDF